jgi:predicted O-methyltransferase YrrM
MMSTFDRQFNDLAKRIQGVPWMTEIQGRRIWEHFRTTRPAIALDIGTCYGTSAAYMAGAMRALGAGRVVTVDSGQFDDRSQAREWCEILWERCEVRDLIEVIRIPHSTYSWWLMEQTSARTDRTGNCDPIYDFVYLDGGKLLTLDASAVVFIEQLLKPGGWLLMDDLDWTYSAHPEGVPVVQYPDDVSYHLSDAEISTPHLRAVFDLVVKRHPNFSAFREQDGQWGWALKAPGAVKTVVIESGAAARPQYGAIRAALGRTRRAARKLRR